MLPDPAFIQAIKNGSQNDFSKAVLRGANANARDLDGLTAIEVAERYGRLDLAMRLIELGANVSSEINKRGDTLLHRCCRVGDIGFACLLLGNGADPNARNHAGKCPLHYATIGGYQYLVHELLKAGASVNLATPQGDTALHFAARKGHAPLIRSLLDPAVNADVLAKNNTGYTPLHEAAAAGQDKVVELLLKNRSIGIAERRSLLPGVRRAAELHGHDQTAALILAAEGKSSRSFAGQVSEEREVAQKRSVGR